MFSLFFLSSKVDFDTWRALEAVLRWIVLGGRIGPVAPQRHVLAVDAPDLRFGVLGHGCMEPEPIASVQMFDPAHLQPPKCVLPRRA